ncbi:hypothetical protein F8M41_007480 [Gigaspora margarita]|uniref:Uncharacterized protein n=1 Tax=Gigaspora margarita TaxID=4874 RepID=A0A8H3X686_GIGMA|nr:hypothetical protein F8M41_007480 [Gigaspora margarita]
MFISNFNMNSVIPLINSIIEYFEPWGNIQLLISSIVDYLESIYFPLVLPVDGPIFHTLSYTFVILASSQIIDQRPKGLFLANVADKVGHAPQIENQIIVQYLKDLAENTYQTGKKVEKLFSIGAYSINRIGNEITSIRETVTFNIILSRRNAIYLSNRINKHLFQTTEFRDQFKAIHVAIDDEEKIWNGTQYGINSFSDVEKYFELIKPTGHKIYKCMNIVNSLAVFKRECLVTFEARREIENALKVAEQVRLELIHSKEIIRGLNKKKIISQTDLMNLESIEVLAEIVSASWAEKDKSKIIIH